jgi:hypothetical protein
MFARLIGAFCLIVPLLAAPTNNDLSAQQAQGPPKECEKPFGEGKLATGPNPYNFTVFAKQQSIVTKYKETFKGAPVDMIITFTAPPGTGSVKAFAMRCGLPFPVVQWQNTGDSQTKIVSCIAPQSLDTIVGQVSQASIGQQQRFSVSAVPLLAAWANHDTVPVVYEMAIQSADGQIYVAAYNGTIKVKETDYKLPEKFFRPPPRMTQQNQNGQDPRFNQGQMNQFQQDPRFQQQQFNQQQQFGQQQFGSRKKRDTFVDEFVQAEVEEEPGN